jgi:hypothetical protein
MTTFPTGLDPVSEVDSDDAHPFDQSIVEDLFGTPTSTEQDVCALYDLVGQAIVKVVMHLRSEFFIIEIGEIEVLIVI